MIKVKHLVAICCVIYLSYLYHLISPVKLHDHQIIEQTQIFQKPTEIIADPNIKKKHIATPVVKNEDTVLVKYVLDNSDECNYDQAHQIVHEVKKYKNPLLLLSIIKVESNFDRKAVSKKKAAGLGQIMKVHVPDLKEKKIITQHSDLFKIKPNIEATSHILEKYKDGSKDLPKALARYGNSKHYAKLVAKEYYKLVRLST